MSQKSRLDRVARRCGPPPASELSQERGEQIIQRLAEVTAEHGGPEGVRLWLETVWPEGGPPLRSGADRGRLKAKVIAMSRILSAQTPDEKRQGWDELRAIGRH